MIPYGTPVVVALLDGRDLSGAIHAAPPGCYVLATERGPAFLSRSIVGAVKSAPALDTSRLAGGDLVDLVGRLVAVNVAGFGTMIGALLEVWPGRAGVDIRTDSGEVLHVPLERASVEALR